MIFRKHSNVSKRWNGEFWGFRIGFVLTIRFGLAVPPLPHIVVFRVCLYNGTLCCGFLCARLISASFPATTPRLPRPYRYVQANRLPRLQGYHTRATTLHTNFWIPQAGLSHLREVFSYFSFHQLIRRCFHNNNRNFPTEPGAHLSLIHI